MSPLQLYIEESKESPLVKYDAKNAVFKIEGRSLLENPYAFYQEIINWMKDFVKNSDDKITFDVYLDYFNSSSGRYLLEFFIQADKEPDRFNIIWYADENDEVMIEKGMEFEYLLKMPLKVVTR